jgi:hypothetical protein
MMMVLAAAVDALLRTPDADDVFLERRPMLATFFAVERALR